jgi:hypothetical protein
MLRLVFAEQFQRPHAVARSDARIAAVGERFQHGAAVVGHGAEMSVNVMAWVPPEVCSVVVYVNVCVDSLPFVPR